jgi:hypothetical protein
MEFSTTESDNEKKPAEVENHPDLMTLDQLEQIKKEISENQQMVGQIQSVLQLLPIYRDSPNPGFIPGFEYLAKKCRGMRTIRGDGNCFYRALLFGYLERILEGLKSENEEIVAIARQELQRMIEKIQGSMKDLTDVGYSEFTIEIFYDVNILLYIMQYNIHDC